FSTSSEYKEFVEFNSVRGLVHGFPVAKRNEKNRKLLNINAWTENDYAIMLYWFFQHEGKFNKEKFQNILKFDKKAASEIKRLSAANLAITGDRIFNRHFIPVIIFSAILLYGLGRKDISRVLINFFYFAYVVLL